MVPDDQVGGAAEETAQDSAVYGDSPVPYLDYPDRVVLVPITDNFTSGFFRLKQIG
jgi:hypothetical protein